MDRAEYERRFRRAGLPVFVAGRTAAPDIWTRATPLLSLVFALELLGAIDLQWSPLANVGAVAGGLAVLAAALAPVNYRRHRPLLDRPTTTGPFELASCSPPQSCHLGRPPRPTPP